MSGTVYFLALVALFVTIALVSIWNGERQRRIREQQQRESSRVALELHPQYMAKLAADRAYLLQRERQTVELALRQREFDLKRYMALHYISPETYVVDRELHSVIPLQGLKHVPQ